MKKTDVFFSTLLKTTLFISKNYFRAEVRGMKNLPEGPCLLVGNHNGIGVVNPEIWIFGSHYLREENKREMKVLGHDLALRLPFVSQFAKNTLGYIPNSIANGVEALKAGHNVLVYPGGAWESCRPSRDRDIVDFKQRTGFIKLAREAKVPIVPVVAAGAHDGVFVWRRGFRIAKWIQLHRLTRIDAFPIGLSFPFFFHIGLVPFIPLPRKVLMEILPPIELQEHMSDSESAQMIVQIMQESLTKLSSELPRSK